MNRAFNIAPISAPWSFDAPVDLNAPGLADRIRKLPPGKVYGIHGRGGMGYAIRRAIGGPDPLLDRYVYMLDQYAENAVAARVRLHEAIAWIRTWRANGQHRQESESDLIFQHTFACRVALAMYRSQLRIVADKMEA